MKQIKPPELHIRAWREKCGLRNIDLAEALGVSASQLAQWESGFRIPTRQTQAEIAAVLGVNYLSLYSLPANEVTHAKGSNRSRPTRNKPSSKL